MHAASRVSPHAGTYPAAEASVRRWPLNALVIAAVLLIGAALTALAWRDAVQDQQAAIHRALISRATQIETMLADRMLAYEALLYAGAGLFDASETVTAEEWREFALRLRAATLYPGLQGYGFARREPSPSGALADRDYTSIVYLEPRTERNLAAMGFDMMSNPVRRAAMERARDTGTTTLSGRVTLVQEITTRKQAGFLLYLPVYEHGSSQRTVAGRRAALVGYVYCPFRAEDFLTAVLGDVTGDVSLEVFDAPRDGPPSLMFVSSGRADSASAGFERERTLKMMGRSWLLKISATPAFIEQRSSSDAERVLWLGASGTLLIAGFVWALALSRTRLARQLRAEQASMQRERHSAELLANSLDAYVAIDAEDRVVEWNRQAELTFGWSVAEARERKLVDLIVPERFRRPHVEAVRTFAERSTHTLVGRRIEMPALRRDGGEITVELSILATTRGDRPLYAASLRDVTELKRHEAEILALNTTLEHRVETRTQELAEANRDLKFANEQLEAFAQNVSHDLRAPLRAIDGFLRLAAEESGEGRRAADRYMTEASRHIRKMQQIIDDLLKLAFIGRQPVQKRAVDLRATIAAMLPDLNVHQPPAQVTLKEDLGTTFADPALLEHALRNLLSNAFKFSGSAPEPRVEVGVANMDGERVYYVRDNGVGFDGDSASGLFRAFTRLHAPSEFEGSGVGLTIVKSVVEKHGGRIWADAARGTGATFYFTLPDR